MVSYSNFHHDSDQFVKSDIHGHPPCSCKGYVRSRLRSESRQLDTLRRPRRYRMRRRMSFGRLHSESSEFDSKDILVVTLPFMPSTNRRRPQCRDHSACIGSKLSCSLVHTIESTVSIYASPPSVSPQQYSL